MFRSHWPAELMIEAFFDKVKVILKESDIAHEYCGEAMIHSASIHNITLSLLIFNHTRCEEILMHWPAVKKPHMSGYETYNLIHNANRASNQTGCIKGGATTGIAERQHWMFYCNSRCLVYRKHVKLEVALMSLAKKPKQLPEISTDNIE